MHKVIVFTEPIREQRLQSKQTKFQSDKRLKVEMKHAIWLTFSRARKKEEASIPVGSKKLAKLLMNF